MRIAASKEGFYDLENQIFVAQGDVVVTYEDLILEGDELEMDFSTNEARLQGNVHLKQGEQEFWGESLLYNLETGEGVFDHARTEIPLSKETGSIFLSGKSVDLHSEKYAVKNAQFTTCDVSPSHYHVATKDLEVILGEKVIIRGVTYYEGKIPIFYWPYLVIPLNIDDENRFFSLPALGFSEQEGYYMKNTFNYHFNSKSYGNIYLDLFTRLGVGLGVRHNYDMDAWGKGSVYLYALPNRESPVYKGSFNHEWKKGNWVFKTNTSANQESALNKQDFNSNNRLTLTLPKLTAETWFDYKSNPFASSTQIKMQKDLGLRWYQTLNDKWRLNLRGSLTERQQIETLRLIDYLAETTYRQGKHTLTLAAQQQYNPDLLTTESQPWMSVQRLPELKWDVSDLGLAKLPLKSQVILGRYGERPSLVTKNRVLGQLGLKPQIWRPTKMTSLNYQADVYTALYTEGERQTWLYGRGILTQKLVANWQFTSTYTRRDVWGTTPFRFDKQLPLETVNLRLSHTDTKWYGSLNTTYNFHTKKFDVLTLQTRFTPNENWNLDVYAAYDITSKTLQRVVPLVEYKKEQVTVKLGAIYQPVKKTVDRVDLRLALPLGSTWQVGYDSIFEPPKQVFTQGKITLKKDLHCRELSVSYDHVGKRVALQYTIKAFPTLPIGWDSQGGLSLFDLEDVADLLEPEE